MPDTAGLTRTPDHDQRRRSALFGNGYDDDLVGPQLAAVLRSHQQGQLDSARWQRVLQDDRPLTALVDQHVIGTAIDAIKFEHIVIGQKTDRSARFAAPGDHRCTSWRNTDDVKYRRGQHGSTGIGFGDRASRGHGIAGGRHACAVVGWARTIHDESQRGGNRQRGQGCSDDKRPRRGHGLSPVIHQPE